MAGARRFAVVSLIGLIVAAASTPAAEPPKDDRCLTNKQLIDTLASIHNRGATLYNSGDVAGAYRLFQGALLAVHPMLPKDIQEDVTDEMTRTDRQFDLGRRAFALHELIETVRKRLHPSGAAIPLPKPRKLEGETDEPPKAKTSPEPPKVDPGKKPENPPLLLEPPKSKSAGSNDAKPKPIGSDGLIIPLPVPGDAPVEPKKKESEKKEPVRIDLDVIAPPLKLDSPMDKPLITIPSGASVPKPEPLPPPRIDLPMPAIPTSNPKPSNAPMPPPAEPPNIILPPGK